MAKTYTYYPVGCRSHEEATELSFKKKPTLRQLQTLVGGLIEIVTLPDRSSLIFNEEGLIHELPVNNMATEIWRKAFPLSKYPHNNLAYTVGIRGPMIHEKNV